MKRICEICNIKKLSLLYPGDFITLDNALITNGENEYYKNIDIFKKKLGILSSYFFGHNHDSSINKIKMNNNDLIIELNDVSTREFALAYSNVYEIPINQTKVKFPCTIKFSDIHHFSLNTILKKGKIKRQSHEKLEMISEYLYEEFYRIENKKIELSLNVWSKAFRYERNPWLILIECEGIQVMQNFKDNWINIFGTNAIEAYDQYFRDRNNNVYFGDYSFCIEYLQKIKNA